MVLQTRYRFAKEPSQRNTKFLQRYEPLDMAYEEWSKSTGQIFGWISEYTMPFEMVVGLMGLSFIELEG